MQNLFATTAQATPERVAIVTAGQRLTYGELWRRVQRLAGLLQRVLGVQPGDRVLLDLQNGPALVVAYHAVLHAGAVVLPSNPMNRSDELRWLVADSGARVAIVAPELLPQVQPLRAEGLLQHVLPADDDIDGGDPLLQPMPRSSDDLAVLAYTSGTTGHPKGCMLSHGALRASLQILADWNAWTADAVALATAPFFHVTGMQGSMNLPLLCGARVVLMPRWDRAQAAQLIAAEQVTHWTNVPTMVSDLLALPDLGAEQLRSLRYIGGGGTAMPEAVAARLHALTGLEYQEGWGLTEVCGAIHLNPVRGARRQCLGLRTPNVDTRVRDPDTGLEKPVGEHGELVTRGPTMFSGYWNNAAATDAAFCQLDGQRWFRTGDIGWVDADGFFTMADRLKRMINASGYKVWPAEVETLLYRHPAVREACVVGVPDPRRGETVKAYIVRADGADVNEQQIIDWSREHMAAYKIPRVVAFVERLPRSGSGKILWRALQEGSQVA